jgi:vacuolar-type H+-ATPase subunit H
MKLSSESKKYLATIVDEEFKAAIEAANDAFAKSEATGEKLFQAFEDNLEELKKEFISKAGKLIKDMGLTYTDHYTGVTSVVRVTTPYGNTSELARWVFVETALDAGATKAFRDGLDILLNAKNRAIGRIALVTDASKGAEGVEDTVRRIARDELKEAQEKVGSICKKIAKQTVKQVKKITKKGK